jgi:ferredoxin
MNEIFRVDASRCVKCAMCVKDCFFGALRQGDDGLPVMAEPEKCMRCQHCLAVCPKAAVSLGGRNPDDSLPAEGLELPSAAAAENYLRSRRSVRRYQDRDVDGAMIRRLLKVLGNSPTGCNARALKFTCLSTRKAMDDFRDRFINVIESHRDGTKLLPRWLALPAIQMRKGKSDIFFRGAPAMLIVSADEKAPALTTPNEDVAIACSNFELLAASHGLGTCWCGFLKLVQREVPELLSEIFGFSATTPFYAILFGHPAIRYSRTVQRDDEARIDWYE